MNNLDIGRQLFTATCSRMFTFTARFILSKRYGFLFLSENNNYGVSVTLWNTS